MLGQRANVICNFGVAILLFLPINLALAVSPVSAKQTGRWAADEFLSRANIPLSAGIETVKAATLSCEAQKWSFLLEVENENNLQDHDINFSIDRNSFEGKALFKENMLGIRVPEDALEKLKGGIKLVINLPVTKDENYTTKPVSLSLRGSKIAITEMQKTCRQRDMSDYRALTFTPYSSYAGLAEDLRKKDIESFKTATFSNPVLTVAMAELSKGKRILFTRLCGSSWYYGRSGCNVTGFAQLNNDDEQNTIEGWSVIYDSENVALYIDEKSKSHGWPDLVALPARTAGKGEIWRWADHYYNISAELPDEYDDGLPLFPAD